MHSRDLLFRFRRIGDRLREIPERVPELSLCRKGQQLPGGSVHEYTQLRCRTQIHRPHLPSQQSHSGSQAEDSVPTRDPVFCQHAVRASHRLLQPKRHAGTIQPPDQGRRPLLARRVLLPPEPDERSRPQFQRISVTHPAEGYGNVCPCLL